MPTYQTTLDQLREAYKALSSPSPCWTPDEETARLELIELCRDIAEEHGHELWGKDQAEQRRLNDLHSTKRPATVPRG